jgi:serine/threonine protein kinase
MIAQTISRYKILSKLGEGGMGEVYLAEDTELGRKVALKLLPLHYTSDPEFKTRFKREAKAAAALNHPNIITIYEVGEYENRSYIAMEYIEGQSLKDLIAQKTLTINQVIDMVIQICEGLHKAHEAGITHRDIKPANILVGNEGRVKILDFGLAKLKGATQLTQKESTLGTIHYMSPEQHQSAEVDQRADIWSLGVVLYEMIAGQLPFKGEYETAVLYAVMHETPEPLARYKNGVSEGLQRLVSKSLDKDLETRYQNIRDVLTDLKREKKSASQPSQPVAPAAKAKQRTVAGEFEIARDARLSKRKVGIGVAAVVSIALAGFALYHFIRQDEQQAPTMMSMTRLTNTGKATWHSAISPDGKYVAYVMEDAGKQSLWLKQIATRSDVQIAAPAEVEIFGQTIPVQYSGLTFSYDGNYLYYVNLSGLYQIPVLGGAAKNLLRNVGNYAALSPDGKRLAFVRSLPPNFEVSALMITNIDGSEERELARRQTPAEFNMMGRLSWSPDGKMIAIGETYSGAPRQAVVAVRVNDGVEKPLTSRIWKQIWDVAWLADGTGLVFTGIDETVESQQIWHLSYPEGKIKRITTDLNEYYGLSLTAESNALATTQFQHSSNIWVAAVGKTSQAQQITSGTGLNAGRFGLSWTPDGKIVYSSRASGNADIWITAPDGSQQKQLTVEAGINDFPSVSPDGRYIVFVSNRLGGRNIWKMNIDGSNPKQMTKLDSTFLYFIEPQFSPDGQWIVFSTMTAPGKFVSWKVGIEGGTPVQVGKLSLLSPDISPDGKLIACLLMPDEQNPESQIVIIPMEGGQMTKSFDLPPSALGVSPIRWAPDGRAVTYVDTRDGVSNIWSQPLDGGRPRPLTDFKTDQIHSFDWSPDGKQIAFSRETKIQDVVLIRDF